METNQRIQVDNSELRILLQEVEEENHGLQIQLQAIEEALENLKCNEGLAKPSTPTLESTNEVNNVCYYLVSFSHYDDDFGVFRIYTKSTEERESKSM